MLRKNQIAELDCTKSVHVKSLIADILHHSDRRRFLHRYSSSARQELHFEGQLDGFIPFFRINIFYRNMIVKNIQITISRE